MRGRGFGIVWEEKRWGGTGRRGEARVWGTPKESNSYQRLVKRGQG